jgi:signal transduction histidine kinase
MTLRRIYLADAYITALLGAVVWFAGGRMPLGTSLIALAILVFFVGKNAEFPLLRIGADYFRWAYLAVASPIIFGLFGSDAPVPWRIALVICIFVLMQALSFEDMKETRALHLFSFCRVPNPRNSAELRSDWQEQIREEAIQQERNRLAQELHDSVKQQLFSIQTNLAAAQVRWEGDSPAAREAVSQAREAAHEAGNEIGAMLDQLQPLALESLGLVEAIRRQCAALAHRTGADVRIVLGDLPQLDPETRTVIYRIAQESLANIGRHARASHVDVELSPAAQGDWVLRIRDDGQGLRPNYAKGGGMRSMWKRAGEIGASFTVEGAPGAGCTVTLRFRPRAYADGQTSRHSATMWNHWVVVGIWMVTAFVNQRMGFTPFAWFLSVMVIGELIPAVYHTRQYLRWKGQSA